MAELTPSERSRRVPQGTELEVVVLVTPSGAAATDDWFDSGLSYVTAVVGTSTEGAADAGINVTLRNEGTDPAEPDNDRAVGVESTGTDPVRVTVRGRA